MNEFDFKNPDYLRILKSRENRLLHLRKNAKSLFAAKIFYKTHPVEFINDWGWTHDPRQKIMPMRPFILFEKQKEYIEWVWDLYNNKSDGIVEKSRDMGVTWLSVGFAVWLFLFYENSVICFGSSREDKLDKLGDSNSIFEKIRIFFKYLPPELLPVGFDKHKDVHFKKILNKNNHSVISGESGDQIGRGGRSSIYFKDESAFYDRPLMIESAISQNSDVKIDISTPNRMGDVFYKKRFSGEYPVFIFDWKDDPRKDQEWYDKQKRLYDAIDPIIVAREIDRDYTSASDNICIPAKFVKAAIELDLPKSGKKFAGLDVADEGADKNALIIREGSVVKFIEDWKEGNTTQTASKAYFICKNKDIDIFNYDSIGVGAGIKGAMWAIRQKNGKNDKEMIITGVGTGESPTDGEYAPGKYNSDMFMNLKAELWWKLRRRFEKTFEYVNVGKKYPVDELISIPNNQELITELSQPKHEYTANGKIQIESKKKMRERGIKSPNLADALVLSFFMPVEIDIMIL